MLSRRGFLWGVGGSFVAVAAVLGNQTGAFLSSLGIRTSDIPVASDPNAIIGLDVQSPVQKNSRDPLVYVTNTVKESVSVTLSLKTCSDGTLYDPEGDSGCTVTSTIASGNTVQFDIEAAVSGQYVDFTVDASSSSFSLSTSNRTYAEAGQTKNETWIKKLQGLTARESPDNDWTIKDVKVEDVEGAENLDRVEFDVTEPDGTSVGTYTADCSDNSVDCNGGAKYQPKGNPSVEIEADGGYTVDSSITYTVTVTAYDKDGNSDSDTLSSDE